MAEVVRVETARGVMTATLADEANRNALGAELLSGLRAALRAANADPGVRALVITNQGNTFCAGANLKERSAANRAGRGGGADRSGAGAGLGGFETLLQELWDSPTPTVGRIAGHVVGGGNGLASALDIAIAADHVKFGFSEVRLGVIPAVISVVCLPKMRHGEALEVFLRGNRFPAARAAELGLISRAVPAAELDSAVAEVLADLRKGGPQALGHAKRLVHQVPDMERSAAFAWTAKLSAELFASEEAAEGMQAFLQKRAPAWAAEPED